MSPYLIALFAAVGVGAWSYNKAMRYTGNNTRNSLTLAIAVGIVMFVIMLTVVNVVDSLVEN